MEGAEPLSIRLLHVIASGYRRGAEIFASDLVRALGEGTVSQHVAVLRSNEPVDIAITAPTTIMARENFSSPWIRIRPVIVRGLRRLIFNLKPDIVQVHGGEPLMYAVLAAKGSPARVVYRRIGSTEGRGIGGIRRAVHGSLIRRAQRIVTVAEALRRETVETFGVRPETVVTIPNGVDLSRMEPKRSRDAVRRALGVDPNARVVLSLGALTWEKDPIGHLDVTAEVLQEHPKSVHLIAGEGPLRGEVEAAVRSRGLMDRVHVLGSRSDVADLLRASDVLLLASRTEGMPGCIIEAGIRGVPVAAYALSGVPEIVRDGVTGLLAPPGDVRFLVSCVRTLLGDGARRKMGRAAMQQYRSSFDIRTIAPSYASLYRELLES